MVEIRGSNPMFGIKLRIFSHRHYDLFCEKTDFKFMAKQFVTQLRDCFTIVRQSVDSFTSPSCQIGL